MTGPVRAVSVANSPVIASESLSQSSDTGLVDSLAKLLQAFLQSFVGTAEAQVPPELIFELEPQTTARTSGETEGGGCDFESNQETGDTGDVEVNATSGDATGGEATANGGNFEANMGVGGNGGGSGAVGGSGDGGPGGPATCNNCRISGEGGQATATGGAAQSGSVEVQETESGSSGDAEFDVSSNDRDNDQVDSKQ